MTAEPPSLAETLARVAGEVYELSLEEAATSVAIVTTSLLLAEGAYVVLRTRGKPDVVAGSDEDTERLALEQITAADGPCLEALRCRESVLVDDVTVDQRWPRWRQDMGRRGFASALSLPLLSGRTMHGAITVISSSAGWFDSGRRATAELVRSHATISLAVAKQEQSLWQAMDARLLIGQAQGVLMERFQMDADQAFAVLRRYSQDNNRKLQDVAQQVATTRRLPGEEDRAPARPNPEATITK